ncbi:TPA: hypothetical protein ACGUOU_004396 [Vibrio vulnificus]|nr:hypothetical protein [Vibrio vulnificus]
MLHGRWIIKFVFLFVVGANYSMEVSANNGVLPDKTYNIHMKYDPNSGEFYQFGEVDSRWYVLEQTTDSEISFKHALDNWLGTPISRDRERFNIETKKRTFQLLDHQGYNPLPVESAIAYAETQFANTTPITWGEGSAGPCNPSIGVEKFSNRVEFGVPNPYEASGRCMSAIELVDANRTPITSDIPDRNYVQRLFRFDSSKIKKLPFGTYTGTLHAVNDFWWFYGITARMGYYYNITLNIEPYINEMSLSNSDLSFAVTKTPNYIEGVVSSDFEITGGFNREQKMNIRMVSVNSSSCNGKLCLKKPGSEEVIPYKVELFGGNELLTRTFEESNSISSIYAEKRSLASGRLTFSFLTDSTTFFGDFTDILTVRVELAL